MSATLRNDVAFFGVEKLETSPLFVKSVIKLYLFFTLYLNCLYYICKNTSYVKNGYLFFQNLAVLLQQ